VKAVAMADGYTEDEIATVQGKESAIKLKEEERQTLNEMKALVDEYPTIEAVYFFAIDRLARRVEVVLNVVKEMLDKGVNLVFLNPTKMATIRVDENGNKKENELTKLLLMLLSYGAEMEMKIKTERAVNKKEEMKANNEVIGKLIFGYINVNRKATIDTAHTAPIVKWIFKSYNEDGMSLTKIFDKGVELGYWENLQQRSSRASRIRQILMNYAYCGEPTKSGFVYPKLIEKEEIDKAISNMSQAQNKAKTESKVISLAKGKIKDVQSGYTLKYDGNHLKYVLREDVTGKVISASLNIVDFLVWKEASRVKWNILANKDDNTRNTVGKELDEIDDRICNIQQIIDNEVSERFNKVYKAYINSRGRISDDDYNREVAAVERDEKKYKKQIESLQQRKVELQAVLEDLANRDSKILDPTTIMEITDYAHQKEIADEVIERITVERTEQGQIITIYNKLESKPQQFLNKTVTNHTALYWKLNDESDYLDISDEYRPRYRRTNK
jgi:DNA invertase Pin-like site-specific DNA recombinase